MEREDLLPICLSSAFRSWLEAYSGGGLGVTLRLSISESIAKFPLPSSPVSQGGIDTALRFNDIAVRWSADHQYGLTDVMNAVHSPEFSDADIAKLRSFLGEIDRAVAAAYGWNGLDLTYDFREVNGAKKADPYRYAVSEATRAEILRRLLYLNRQRHEEGASQDRREPPKRFSSRRKPIGEEAANLFGDGVGEMESVDD